jgi:hypothetical protein
MAFFDNTLRKIANDKGYRVGYDAKNDSVIVENPATGKKIQFKSGQGQEYGMGGLDANIGYNVVSDTTLLEKALAADPTPKATGDFFSGASSSFTSPLSGKINEYVEKITGYKPFDPSSYNPYADPSFVKFFENAVIAGNKAYADKFAGTTTPGVAESSIQSQIAETARKGYTDRIQDAIPTFMERAKQEYEKGYQRDFDILGTLTDLDAYSLDRESAVRKNLADEAKIIAMANYDDIAAEINRRKAINPNDPLIPYLEAERQNKIFSQQAAEAESEKERAKKEQTMFEQAMKQWQTSGVASQQVAEILGVPVGAKTADYNINTEKAKLEREKLAQSKTEAEEKAAKESKKELVNHLYNQAKVMLQEKVFTGRYDDKGRPIYRPKYTREDFEIWLDSQLPNTEEGDRMFDEILANLGNVEFLDTNDPAMADSLTQKIRQWFIKKP